MGPAPRSTPPSVLSLTDVTISTVKPLQKKTAHPETVELTLMDGIAKDVYCATFFAYRLASEAAYSQFLKRVKESLQRVLVPFFPFAGRLVPTLGGGRRLLCNDEGVAFIEGYSAKDLDSVVKASAEFQPVPELQGHEFVGLDSSRLVADMLPQGLPAIFVQVTRFKCGGVVLGVTFNHMVVDGKGFFDFMTAWADLSRTNTTTINPNHNRALAKSFEGAFPTKPLSESDAIPLESNGADGEVPPTEKTNADCRKSGPIAMKDFEVSASAIESIKQEVKKSNPGGYVSTVDCIIAHVWQSLAKLPSSIIGTKEVASISLVEGRNRFYDTPVPHLFANVLAFVVGPKIPTAKLLEKPLYVPALKLREHLLATKWASWFTLQRAMETATVFSSEDFAPWITNSWFGFPTYEIDFGFGKPFFNPGTNSKLSVDVMGSSLIMPPIPGSSSSAAILRLTSDPHVLEALEANPSFLPFFLQPVKE